MYRALVFDIGNTLVRTVDLIESAYPEVFARHGIGDGDCLRIRADRSTTCPPDGVLAKDSPCGPRRARSSAFQACWSGDQRYGLEIDAAALVPNQGGFPSRTGRRSHRVRLECGGATDSFAYVVEAIVSLTNL